MKTGKTSGLSEASLELIVACGGVVIQVMVEICQSDLDGFGMPVEWALSMVVPIIKGKCDLRNGSCDRALKFLERRMKVAKKVL